MNTVNKSRLIKPWMAYIFFISFLCMTACDIITYAKKGPVRQSHTSIVHNGKMWIFGGQDLPKNAPVAQYSSDGENWVPSSETPPWAPRHNHVSLIYNDKIWIIGGQNDSEGYKDVWYSNDGESWVRATSNTPWGCMSGFASVVFDDKMWIIGGFDYEDEDLLDAFQNDVWYSSDGKNWIKATDSAPWTPRADLSAIVYNDKIYIFGGWGSEYTFSVSVTPDDNIPVVDIHGSNNVSQSKQDNPYNDVWYSSDGKNWNQVTDNAPWFGLINPCTVEFKDKLWIIGGYSQTEQGPRRASNTIYSTTDGVEWEKNTNAPWLARSNHTVVVFDDRIWVILGWNGDLVSDIWHSKDGLNWELSPSIVK